MDDFGVAGKIISKNFELLLFVNKDDVYFTNGSCSHKIMMMILSSNVSASTQHHVIPSCYLQSMST